MWRYGTGCFLLRNTGTKVRCWSQGKTFFKLHLCVRFLHALVFLPTLSACDVRPRPADHSRLQNGKRGAGVLRTRGVWKISSTLSFWARLYIAVVSHCHLDLMWFESVVFPLRVQWPSQGRWCGGWRTTWASCSPPLRSVLCILPNLMWNSWFINASVGSL